MLGMFSANASALGYFYQARYALLLLLDSDVDSEMSLERFDDISFDQDGVPIQLLQTKHHVNSSGSLSNASTDLWKTLRVWSEAVAKRQIEPSKTVFTLITTNRAPNDSAASKLRPASVGGRDVNSALSTLCETAKKSESSVNRAAYDTFLGLPSPQQTALVTSINVLDSSPNILDTRDLILNRLKYSTRPKFLDLVFERIEGWWMSKVVIHLSNNSSEPIRNRDLQAKINDIQEQYFEALYRTKNDDELWP